MLTYALCLRRHSARGSSLGVCGALVVCLSFSTLARCSNGSDATTGQHDGDAASEASTDVTSGDVGSASDSEGSSIPAVTYRETVLFEGGEDGYAVYRIPSLIELPDGDLLAFAEGRNSIQDDGNIDLVMRRSNDSGLTWGPVEVVIDAGDDTAGNPAPVVDRDTGRLWLPYCTNPGDDMQQRSVWVTYSDDGGRTWAPPRDLTADIKPAGWSWYATGPGRSIQLASGRLLVPSNHVDENGIGRSHVFYSDDHGETWQLGGSTSDGTDESQVVERLDSSVLMVARYEGEVFARAFASSTDGGETFSPVVFEPHLDDPHCQGSVVRTPAGIALSHADTVQEFPRDRVTVRLSEDEGASFDIVRVVDEGPSAYSVLAVLPSGELALAWESGDILPYDRIRFAAFSVAWLRE